MEVGGGEDPFGFLIKFCQPTPSQELKLQNCPFARKDETFPDAFDSLGSSFSPSQSQSQTPGIAMVSLSDSENNDLPINENAPAENVELQTPPEDHLPSSSSSQDDPRRTPTSAVDERVDMKSVTVDDGCRDEELGAENLRVPESVGMEGGDGALGADGVDRDDEVAVELKKFRAYEGESEERALKKIRVSVEVGDSIAHTVHMEGTHITEKGNDDDDEFTDKGLDVEESDEGIILIDVDSTEEESEDNDDEEVSKKGGKGSPDGKSHKGLEVEKIKLEGTHITEKGNDSDDEFTDKGLDVEESDEDIILIDVDSTEEESEENDDEEVSKKGGKGSPDGKSHKGLEVEKIKFGISHSNVSNPGEEEGVHVDNGERSVLRNGYLAFEQSEKALRNNKGGGLRGNGKEVSDRMNKEDIDQFKYNGDNGDHRWKEVVSRKRELPLSMREKSNDRGKMQEIRNLDVKNLSWKELVDASAIFFKKVDHASEDVDFIETAKRKGMIIPKPRWL